MTMLVPRLGLSMLLTQSASSTLNPQLLAAFATKISSFRPGTMETGKKKTAQIDQTPRQEAIISMLMALRQELRDAPKKPPGLPSQMQSAAAAYENHKHARTDTWMRDMRTKCLLQRSALRSLPPGLRVHAMQPDNSPYPPARNFFFDSPPAAYLESGTQQSSQPVQPGSETR
eukprot:CAMPEP_0119108184 /NCGR_PEP_ID=MMETSP1180-20130426/13514_1 /TAXON_ID=3052 ORGANISM="Chlamydomonas cf sp, Strain CCMP681" /NCGR_SAMPLE_ID=MMETSP1180 /ASSEMBLY_ACC=CAM_ASM_000741 /LENGTH=172 /DNA_ID=CAMNT_0007093773 /DNA_START=53 /DNA_END=571 /DNA_ORIENTATION=-